MTSGPTQPTIEAQAFIPQITPTASVPSSHNPIQTTPPDQINTSVMTNKVASFKIPRAWETNAPKFTTESADDLLDFIDQVGEIIALADIKDDTEKKQLLTSYLPVRRRTLWRNMDDYANLSYEDFLKEVYKNYPELKQEREGTIADLEKLCKNHQGIRLQDEGRLKRFGLEFNSLFKKLSKQPAILLNKEACVKYLDTLDTSFANILRSSISARNLLKADINKAAGVQPPVAGANKVDHRKEDPILLKDLIDMAEQLATTGVTGTTWDGYDDKKRSSLFPTVKIERRDERLDGLSEEVAGIRDSIMVVQKEVKASQLELMKAFQTHLKDPPPHREMQQRDPPPHREYNQPREMPNRFGQERPYGRDNSSRTANCFYCDGQDHFSRECPVKIGHINKGWLVIEDGVQKLGDGNTLPRGRGPTAVRVEEYYAKKPVSQNWHATADVFYNGEVSEDKEMDAVWDEMRTLRVKLNQMVGNNMNNRVPVAQPSYLAALPSQQGYMVPSAVQPTYMAQAQQSNAVPDEQAINASVARALMHLLNTNAGESEQYLVTRGGKDTAPQGGQGF